MPVFQIGLLLSMECIEGNGEGLRAEMALKPMQFGSLPDSLSHELMAKDKLNWKKPGSGCKRKKYVHCICLLPKEKKCKAGVTF